jgi:DNA transposition AAA+ family ATPase
MSDLFEFPEKRDHAFVETGFVREAIRSTLATHGDNGIVVWTGRSGVGKTRTGRFMVQGLEQVYSAQNPKAFRSRYYEVGGGTRLSQQRTMRHGIRSLYAATVGPLDERVWRRDPEEEIAARLVKSLQLKRLQLVVVDEAGLLSKEEIRGMVLVRDVAEAAGWPLTLVLIGMDDLPLTLTKLPQIERRVHAWIFFEPYDLDDTWELLARLHAHFAGLDRKSREAREQVAFVHATFEGLVGRMIPFLRRLDLRHRKQPSIPVDLALLEYVWEEMKKGKDDCLGLE